MACATPGKPWQASRQKVWEASSQDAERQTLQGTSTLSGELEAPSLDPPSQVGAMFAAIVEPFFDECPGFGAPTERAALRDLFHWATAAAASYSFELGDEGFHVRYDGGACVALDALCQSAFPTAAPPNCGSASLERLLCGLTRYRVASAPRTNFLCSKGSVCRATLQGMRAGHGAAVGSAEPRHGLVQRALAPQRGVGVSANDRNACDRGRRGAREQLRRAQQRRAPAQARRAPQLACSCLPVTAPGALSSASAHDCKLHECPGRVCTEVAARSVPPMQVRFCGAHSHRRHGTAAARCGILRPGARAPRRARPAARLRRRQAVAAAQPTRLCARAAGGGTADEPPAATRRHRARDEQPAAAG